MTDFSRGATWYVKLIETDSKQELVVGPFDSNGSAEMWAIHEVQDEGYAVEWQAFHMVHPDFAAEYMQDEWRIGPGHVQSWDENDHAKAMAHAAVEDGAKIVARMPSEVVRLALAAGAYAAQHEEIEHVQVRVDEKHHMICVVAFGRCTDSQYRNVVDYVLDHKLGEGWHWAVQLEEPLGSEVVIFDTMAE